MSQPNRPVLQPGPEHPISVSTTPINVRVSAGGDLVAESAEAIELREHVYAPVLYVDRADLPADRLERSQTTSWCPYKGEANYFHLVLEDGTKLVDAVWTYESPFEAVAAIKDRLGFYPDLVTVAVI